MDALDAVEWVVVVVCLLTLAVVVLVFVPDAGLVCVPAGLTVVCHSVAVAPVISDLEVGASNVASLWSPYEAGSA